MPPKLLIVYKELGETPLECLERSRIEHAIGASIPMTYAGRLDPMAQGVMILLLGEECKNKEHYMGLDKVYEFQVLVGFSTDTYDLLGLIVSIASSKEGFERSSDFLAKFFGKLGQPISNPCLDSALELQKILDQFVGTFTQKYPSFSSKAVGGKQLFQLSRDSELPSELPEHEVIITKLECISMLKLTNDELQKEIVRRIGLVHGDFRQDEIIKKWNEVLKESNETEFTIFTCVAECSSGTYIRQLVADLSEKIGIPLVTYAIKRTRVGGYSI